MVESLREKIILKGLVNSFRVVGKMNREMASQRMLNALEPGTVMPVHRHMKSSETVVCIRGHFEEYFYNDNGVLTDTIDMVPGGVVLNVPIGMWHSLKSLESGTVLLECKDGKWEPLGEGEVMESAFLR